MIKRLLLRSVANPGLFAALVITAILLVAAYQIRPLYDIEIGTPQASPLLRGFHAPEKTSGDAPVSFRWTTAEALITLRDVGRQEFDVVLTLGGSRPAGQPPASVSLQVDGRAVFDVEPPPGVFTEYALKVPREATQNGTLALQLTSNTFSPGGDERELGVLVTHLKASPSTSPDRFVEPPVGPFVSVLSAVALLGLALGLFGWGPGGVALGASLPGLLAAWLLASDRLWLTSRGWYEVWPQAMLAATIFAGLVWLVALLVMRSTHRLLPVPERRLLLTAMLAAFAVRFAGQMHPQIFIVDLFFHLHRLETVQTGQLLFTIASAEWGGRSTFYLPTSYIFILPLQWLLGDPLLAIKLFTVGVSTLGALPVYLVARRVAGGHSGLPSALLYLAVPIAVLPFSWGITTNIFGEFFALCAFALLALGMPYRGLQGPVLLFTAALFLALLSHPGVVQLSGLATLLTALAFFLYGRDKGWTRGAGRLMLGLFVAAGLAFLLYYRNFASEMITTLTEIRAEREAAKPPGTLHLLVGGSVSDRSLGLVVRYAETWGEWFQGGLTGFWREAQAYYRVWPLTGAALGLSLLWGGRSNRSRNRVGRARIVALVSLCWLLAVALFAIVGWVANLYVRYALFALPVITLAAGVLLTKLSNRGRLGVALVALVLLFFAYEALVLWQYRITYAFK